MDISTWLSTYWQPLLIGGVIGLILGWLVFYLPMRGRVKRHEAEAADLNGKLASSDKAVKEARQQAENMQADLQAQQVRYSSAQGQIAALQADVETVKSQKDAMDASLLERSAEMEQLQGLNEQLRSDYAGLFGQFEQAQQERDAYKATLETTTLDLGSMRNELATSADMLANKEVALNEAYLRAVKLQRELMEHQSLLAATQSELAELRRDVGSLSSLNSDLEGKLQNARGDVAGELALLTSTMLRMKEESLNQANHRIVALTAELDAMRAGKVSTR
jgi:chromosome segregation ATPase